MYNKKKKEVVIPFLMGIILLLSLSLVMAHGDEVDEHEEELTINSEETQQQSLKIILIAGGIAIVLVIGAILHGNLQERGKWILFLGIAIPIVIATLFSAGSTIYLNVISSTKGPVHWHTDFEIWKCGEKIDLKDPTGLSNRLGSAVFHEHGDDRLHVEGVVVNPRDASLHNFFDFIGGELSLNKLLVPTNEGFLTALDGERCNGQPGKLQVFVYSIGNPDDNKNWIYQQKKIDDFTDYILAPYPGVPPGDCIIIEYDVDKPLTDKLCSSYALAVEQGELRGS